MPRKQGRSTPAPQASGLISAGLLIKAAEGLRQLKRRPTEEAAHNKSMPGKKRKSSDFFGYSTFLLEMPPMEPK